LLRDPTFTFAPIDFTLARESAHLASTLRLKGSDAIYVALAQHLDVRLITWDKEQVERGGQVIDVLSPAQALEHLV
jgi:predicted nucleic acid-binding protein